MPDLFAIVYLCVGLVGQPDLHLYEPLSGSVAVCVDVGLEAVVQEVDVPLAIALAYRESRFKSEGMSVSSAGCLGPLQVSVRYQCLVRDEDGHPVRGADGERIRIPLEECDLVAVGVAALRRYLREYQGDEIAAVARYNGGRRPSSGAFAYAERVVALATRIRGWQ